MSRMTLSTVAVLFVVLPSYRARAIPVFDAANVAQATISAVEDVNQTARAILAYKTQLDQYEVMLRDSVVPAVYLWDQVNETIDNVQAVNTALQNYRGISGSIHESLRKFGDLDYYRSSPCYNSAGAKGGCWALIKASRERERFGSTSQKDANDALFESLDRQQRGLEKRSERLEQLQQNSQSAKGQLEAAQYANQLSSAQITELMELRALLLAQQNVAATQNQAQIAREAEQRASAEALRSSKFEASPERKW